MVRDIQRPLEESQPAEAPDLRPPAPGANGPLGPEAHPTLPPPAGRWWPRTWRRLRRQPRAAWLATLGAGRRTRAWARRPTGRLAVPAALIGALVAGAAATGFVVPQTGVPVAGGTGAATSEPTPAAPTGAPAIRPTPAPTGSPLPPGGPPSEVLRGWAQQMSTRTGIPPVALQAYGYAELVLSQTQPGCNLSWTTLAAIGRVESDHGGSGQSTLGPDGRAWPAIIGPPLDGAGGRELIEDTDDGALDGDPVYDRAIGPMQFLPQTWEVEQIDATGDGVADPHSIHDSALAAANYLCRGGRDLSTASDWWTAVLDYNRVQRYADDVFTAANEYGQLSHG